MTIGPEPRIRIRRMSVRLGMRRRFLRAGSGRGRHAAGPRRSEDTGRPRREEPRAHVRARMVGVRRRPFTIAPMPWVRRRYRTNKVWIEVDDDGAYVLDERGLARLRYKPEDDRTYSVKPREVVAVDDASAPLLSAPAAEVSSPARGDDR